MNTTDRPYPEPTEALPAPWNWARPGDTVWVLTPGRYSRADAVKAVKVARNTKTQVVLEDGTRYRVGAYDTSSLSRPGNGPWDLSFVCYPVDSPNALQVRERFLAFEHERKVRAAVLHHIRTVEAWAGSGKPLSDRSALETARAALLGAVAVLDAEKTGKDT